MPRCRHRGWLHVVADDGDAATNSQSFTLRVSDRLDQLVEELPQPEEQRPGLVLMLGGGRKDKALRALLRSRTERDRRGRDADIELTLDPATAFTERPVMFADAHSAPPRRRPSAPPAKGCHRDWEVHVPTDRSTPWGELQVVPPDLLAARLIAPFTDVVCVFLRDFPSPTIALERLSTWIDLGPPSTLPRAVRPHLVLVEDRATVRKHSAAAVVKRLSRPSPVAFKNVFSGVTTIGLREDSPLGPAAKYLHLRETILNQLDRVQQSRREAQALFSARHLLAFFHRALDHFGAARREPFDLIHAARLHDEVPDDLADSLADFLKDFRSTASLVALALPLVVTSLLLNHYRPETHLFDPTQVFLTLYAEPCLTALTRTATVRGHRALSPSLLLELTQQKFQSLFKGWQASAVDLVSFHRRYVRRLKGHWQTAYSAETCYQCLVSRHPEYRLACAHRLCQTCVQVEGKNSVRDPCTYDLPTCPLCGSDTGVSGIWIPPVLAGIRALSVDGGGCRGIIPLSLFATLERQLNIPGIVHRAFDVVIGTSSGGIDIVGVFHKGWSIQRCQNIFQNVAKNVFVRHTVRRPRVMPSIQHALLSCLRDTLYPAEGVNRVLRTVFGERTHLDDPASFATRYGIKLGLTAATVRGPIQRLLFTNYNGFGRRLDGCDYRAFCGDTPRLWECVRCTTAAPVYFPPHVPEGWRDPVQDGGTFELGPARVALAESWALASARRGSPYAAHPLDYLASAGTGSTLVSGADETVDASPVDDRRGAVRRALRESGIGQMYEFLNSTLCGDTMWRKLLVANPDLVHDGRCFRFNHQFSPVVPKLDSVDAIPAMQSAAERAFQLSPQLPRFGRLVVSNLFYLELIDASVDRAGSYTFVGHVRCRWKAPHPFYDRFRDHVLRSGAVVVVQGIRAGGCILDDQGNLDRPVCVKITDLLAPLNVQLRTEESLEHISGSPFHMAPCWRDVYWQRAFGTALRPKILTEGQGGAQGPHSRKRPAVDDEEAPRKRRRT